MRYLYTTPRPLTTFPASYPTATPSYKVVDRIDKEITRSRLVQKAKRTRKISRRRKLKRRPTKKRIAKKSSKA